MLPKTMKLNRDERNILHDIENDVFLSESISKKELAELTLIAQNTFAKSRSIKPKLVCVHKSDSM